MDSSYMLWDEFQDYQVRFISTDHFLAKRFDSLTCHLQGSLRLPDNMTLIIMISTGDFQIRWNVLSLSLSERES